VRLYVAMGAVAIVLAAIGFARLIAGAPSSPAATSSAVAPRGPLHVTVYTMSSCPYCKKAERFLKARGVPFEERDVEASETNAREARRLSGRGGVPVIDVDGEIVRGYNEGALTTALENAARKRAGG
jgi:glutaredoxin